MGLFLSLRELKIGVTLALVGLLFGFGLGGAFGAAEDSIKGKLKRDGEAALTSAYAGDEAKMVAVTNKSWSYLKRAHMHGGGMGAAALTMVLLLSMLPGMVVPRKLAATLLGAGSVGYPLFWLLAGLRAPGMGSTGAAKESLSWLALPSSGAFLVGTAMCLLLFLKAVSSVDPDPSESSSAG